MAMAQSKIQTKDDGSEPHPPMSTAVNTKTSSDTNRLSAGASPTDHATIDEKSMPLGWETATTKDGRVYYVDHSTGTTTWDRPSPAPEAQRALLTDEELPPGWEIRYCEDNGRKYYINHTQRYTSWVPPLRGFDLGKQPLPKGWEIRIAKGQRLYYVDHNTKTTSWDPPWADENEAQDGKTARHEDAAVVEKPRGAEERKSQISGQEANFDEDDDCQNVSKL